jgi:hypothetical protein
VRIAQAVLEEHEYGQRDEQHGHRRIIGHNNNNIYWVRAAPFRGGVPVR